MCSQGEKSILMILRLGVDIYRLYLSFNSHLNVANHFFFYHRLTATMDRLSLLVISVVKPSDPYKRLKNVSTFRLKAGYSKYMFIIIFTYDSVLQICGIITWPHIL